MPQKTVTFEELDREKRQDRARDEERLRTGEITPEALQEENSIFPKDAVITFDLIAHAKKAYLLKTTFKKNAPRNGSPPPIG